MFTTLTVHWNCSGAWAGPTPELSGMGMGLGIDILISSHVTLMSFSGWWPQPQVDWSGSLPHPSMVNGLELCSFRRIACRDVVKNGYIRWKQVSQKILVNKSNEESVRVKITSCRSLWCCQALGRDYREMEKSIQIGVQLLSHSIFLLSLHIFPCILLFLCCSSSLFFPIPSFPPALWILLPCHVCSMVDHPQKA